ncbi:MAG: LacI family DNA-binding transcriptional regulator [Actinocatenispora sp.]
MTLEEVAAHAGVSTATVSRVARGVGQVSAPTRDRVTAAIAELGFRPSHFGRALVERRHSALGVVLPGLSGPYHSEVIAGFEEEAVASRLSVLILGTHLLREARDLVLDMADRVDGIAVLGGSVPDEIVDDLVARGCPVVQLAGTHRPGRVTIRTESAEAVRALTTHLLTEHRYERLAFVGSPTGSPDGAARWQGFRQAHRDAGRPVPRRPVLASHDQTGGLRAAEVLFDARTPPRAVVCVNDEAALGVLVAALGRGLAVPADVAITGFDDHPAAALTAPGLTTIRQPMRELGARAVRALRDVIEHGLGGGSEDVLPTSPILRASCGCPASAPTDRDTRRRLRKHAAPHRRSTAPLP